MRFSIKEVDFRQNLRRLRGHTRPCSAKFAGGGNKALDGRAKRIYTLYTIFPRKFRFGAGRRAAPLPPGKGGPIVKISFITNAGGRLCNQDSADVLRHGSLTGAAVADGLGAYKSSDLASAAAVKAALGWLKKAKAGTDVFCAESATKLFRAAHNAVLRAKMRAGVTDGCTTLSVVVTDGNKLLAAHEGDTRIYFFGGGKLEFYSKDHSLARQAADRGEVDYSALRSHADRNKLTRVIGSDYFVQPDFKVHAAMRKGDAALVCSDGFWEYVTEREMEDVLASTDDCDEALSAMRDILVSRAPKYNDNYTAVLLREDGE